MNELNQSEKKQHSNEAFIELTFIFRSISKSALKLNFGNNDGVFQVKYFKKFLKNFRVFFVS